MSSRLQASAIILGMKDEMDHEVFPSAAAEPGYLAIKAWRLLVGIRVDLRDRFASTAAEVDLPLAQAHALIQIDPQQPVSMHTLAQCIGNDPSNVTGLVDRLEARGLVARRPHVQDRRIKEIVLTASGAELRSRLHAQLYAPPAALKQLTVDELRLFCEVLERLSESSAPD